MTVQIIRDVRISEDQIIRVLLYLSFYLLANLNAVFKLHFTA